MDGRTVVVTGASSGIGRATALALAGRGDHVVLAARDRQALEDVAEQCRAAGGTADVIPTDVTDADAVHELARRAAAGGRLDGWVNAAAVWSHGRFTDTPDAVLRQVLDTTYLGTVHGTRAALEVMLPRGGGVVVCVSSLYGLLGAPYVAPYMAAKWAVTGLCEAVRPELLGTGVHLCTVLPGAVDTPIHRSAATVLRRRLRPLPPVVTPESVADAVVAVLDRPRPRTVVGKAQLPAVWLQRAAPGVADRLLRWGQDVVAGAHGGTASRPSSEGPAVLVDEGNLATPGDHATRDGWVARDRSVAAGAFGLAAAALVTAARRRGGRGRGSGS